jgi:mRNA interferase MazF
MKRGDIVLIAFPFSDLSANKVRPALVLSPEDPTEVDVVLALITSNVQRPLRSSDFLLKRSSPEYPTKGLKSDSVFRMSKVHNLRKALVKRHLGFASRKLMEELDEKLKLALGLQ